MPSLPVQRSIKHLTDNGWQVAIIEKYVKHPGMPFGRRIDVWGFGDLLVCRPATKVGDKVFPAAIGLVQCCRDGDLAAHRAKITEDEEIRPRFLRWKDSGGLVFLQGWGKKGKRGTRKRWTLREEVL